MLNSGRFSLKENHVLLFNVAAMERGYDEDSKEEFQNEAQWVMAIYTGYKNSSITGEGHEFLLVESELANMKKCIHLGEDDFESYGYIWKWLPIEENRIVKNLQEGMNDIMKRVGLDIHE